MMKKEHEREYIWKMKCRCGYATDDKTDFQKHIDKFNRLGNSHQKLERPRYR